MKKNKAWKCPRCGCPDALAKVRERNLELVLVDRECIDCGFCWSAVEKYKDYEKEVVGFVWVPDGATKL